MDRETLVRELSARLPGSRVIWQPKDLVAYSRDASFFSQLQELIPDVVVLPDSTQDVAALVAFAHETGVPVTARGAGTGMTCGGLAVRGGIVADMSAMRRIIEVDALNLQVVAEPGVVHADLNARLAQHKLFFPPDPGSSKMCTLGGMVSNNCRGMRAIKYGATGDYVLGMEVVLPTGQIIQPGSATSRTVQSSSGFDLHKLFVKAEGMLGIITLLRLKVLPIPARRGIVMALYDELERCGEAVSHVFQSGIMPSAIEILDASAILAANMYRPRLKLPQADAMLLFEVDGNPPGVAFELGRIVDVVRPLAAAVDWSDEPGRVASLWEARSVVGAAASKIRPGAARVCAGEDIAVPITAVPKALRGIREISRRKGVAVLTFGHIGNGGLHTSLVIDPADPAEIRAALDVVEEIHALAHRLNGTVTGEHGVGLVRAQYMPEEHDSALETMKTIKNALDPRGIMNPGKMWPDSAGEHRPGEEPGRGSGEAGGE